MSFYVAKNESLADKLFSADTLMHAAPDYYRDRFEAIADLRKMDDGSLHRGNEFRRVASLVNVPMLQALKLIEPEFLSDKRKFYAFLAKHPEYKSYDQRGGSRPTSTAVNGVVVVGAGAETSVIAVTDPDLAVEPLIVPVTEAPSEPSPEQA